MSSERTESPIESIAVVGMSGRFPGAGNLDRFWENLESGTESIEYPSDDDLRALGVDDVTLGKPNYVKARSAVEEMDRFDASFFGINPGEARILDPQHRIFLECAWEALENAGYDVQSYDGVVGVYASASSSSYFLYNLFLNRELRELVGSFQLAIGNDREFLPTRVSYKLDLTGPSVNVQTACSSSLVAVHHACQSLLNYQCDMCLAGGTSIRSSLGGYFYMEGGILSPDGHCRAFDANAQGTIFGSGVGIVVLKRLRDALDQGDRIHAVIRGTAINNDGSSKVGYTAPGVEGQTRVIAEAQAIAGVDPATIGYIEAHGTATALGDPIEVAALSRVFRARTKRRQYCALGTVKSNIGHLDAAAGITGLLKTVLAVEKATLVPSLHYTAPNPEIDFESSPFFVGTETRPWETGGEPRRAGVSSFGIGGTNAHAIVESAPEQPVADGAVSPQLLLLSARTASALDTATENLARHLEENPDVSLADVAYTLRVGRASFEHRRMLVAGDVDDAREALGAADPRRLQGSVQESGERPVVFMFSGQGSQYVGMGAGLYRDEPVFRGHLDECLGLLEEDAGLELAPILYPEGKNAEGAAEELEQTRVAQPALFAVEYALARLWMEWGVRPEAMIGHSIGEYVAACLAGVFSLRDALLLVAERGRLMQSMPSGSMLSVPLGADELEPLLAEPLSLAAVNAPSLCVVSGPDEAVAALERELTAKNLASRRLHTSHAFHSAMMEPILEPFAAKVAEVERRAPRIRYLSNVSGTWITEAEATDPGYWATHLRQGVRFADGMRELAESPDRVLLEVGPGKTLTALSRQQRNRPAGQVAVASMRQPKEERPDLDVLLEARGQLWLAGVETGAAPFHGGEGRRRTPLPTYPFERQRHWIDLPKASETVGAASPLKRSADIADWFFLPSWKRSSPLEALEPAASDAGSWLLFSDPSGLGDRLAERLEEGGHRVFTVRPGDELGRRDDGALTLDPGRRSDYAALLAELGDELRQPLHVVHLWSVTEAGESGSEPESCDRIQRLGFHSLLSLLQAVGERDLSEPVHLTVVSNGLQAVLDGDRVAPAKATLLGPCRVAPTEYPKVTCSSVDVVLPESAEELDRLAASLLAEAASGAEQPVVAYRGEHRWVQAYEPMRLQQADGGRPGLRRGGVCLITGGLGGIGLTLTRHLAETAAAKLVLVSRSSFPEREEWSDWLEANPEPDATSARIRELQEIEALGGEVAVATADVADAEQMAAAVALAEERFGGLHGVVHAAGVPGGGLMQLKSEEAAESILAPKVRGSLVLDSLLEGRELDFFVLCSSLTSILGGVGQVDYCGANAFLDAFAHYRNRRNGGRTVSICWDAWREVGMAVEAAEQHRHPLAKAQPEPAAEPGEESGHPLFDRVRRTEEGEIHAAEMSAERHWVLGEHRIAGKPTLVGTAYLEMARAAFESHAGERAVRLADVVFMMPLTVAEDERRQVQTVVRPSGESYSFVVRSRPQAAGNGGPAWQEHASGRLEAVEAASPRRVDLQALLAACDREVIEPSRGGAAGGGADDGGSAPAPGGMSFGPRWKCLRRIHVGDGQAVAELRLPEEFAADEDELFLHPALLDLATSFAIARLGGGGLFLPFAYGRVEPKAPLRGRLFSHVRFEDEGAGEAREAIRFDVAILDEEGVELVDISGFTMKRVSEKLVQAMAGRRPEGAAAARPEAAPAGRPPAVALAGLEEAIQPREGVEAFQRIVARRGLTQVIVSTKDLEPRVAKAREASAARLLEKMDEQAEASQPKHARPDVKTEFVAPRNELEQAVAAVWQRVLGLEEVGVHDDFIELGGHSLLAIQIVSQLKESFQVDLPVDVILNSPTVAGLAEAIMTGLAESADDELLARMLDEVEQMPEGDEGAASPQ